MPIFGAGIQGQIYGYGINPAFGGLVQVVVKCIPCVKIESLVPAITLIGNYPVSAIASSYPTLQISSLVGALVVVAIFAQIDLQDIKPNLSLEVCDCG